MQILAHIQPKYAMNPNKLNRDKLEQAQLCWKNHRSSILTKT
jgi:hypothetical protein